MIDEISWQQWANLPQMSKLPLHEVEKQYRIYLNEVTEQRIAFMMLQERVSQAEAMAVAASNGGGSLIVSEIVGNHIEFVVDTDNSNFGMAIETNSEITATINWGDEQTEEITLTSGTTELYHDYDPSGQGVQYTVRIEFSDATQVIRLEFFGND
jgi:hypothetical protein